MSISDDILREAQEAIDKALLTPDLPPDRRAVLEVQNYFLMFLRNDHKKIETVYKYYTEEKEQKEKNAKADEWMRRTVYGAAIVALVMLFINGVVFWVSTTPIIQAIMRAGQP